MRRLLAVGLILLATTTYAGVVLCARPRSDGTFKTTVKIRTGSCANHETQLDPVALGLQGPKGDKGDTGDDGPQGSPGTGMVVKDANGTLVGAVVAPGFVAVNLDGQSVRLEVDRTTGFPQDSNFGNFLFANPDCTGDAFPDGQSLDTERLPVPAVQIFRGTVYYPAVPIQIGTPTAQLAQSDNATCIHFGGTIVSSDMCCFPAGPGQFPQPALKRFDLNTLGLVLPFHAEGP